MPIVNIDLVVPASARGEHPFNYPDSFPDEIPLSDHRKRHDAKVAERKALADSPVLPEGTPSFLYQHAKADRDEQLRAMDTEIRNIGHAAESADRHLEYATYQKAIMETKLQLMDAKEKAEAACVAAAGPLLLDVNDLRERLLWLVENRPNPRG